MIAIIDYGAGNPVSVRKALLWLGQECEIVSDADSVGSAGKIILPGVGHFAATRALEQSGIRHVVLDAIGRGVPFLGICVGMQWMFEGSEEAPECGGLGLFAGRCQHFPPTVKSPHVGWNQLSLTDSSLLLRNISPNPFVYFTHSFQGPVVSATTACCDYGGRFSAAVEKTNVFGVQFHPEKSGPVGLKLLANFCSL